MGHRRNSAPNRGSLGIRPRVRAKRFSGRWRTFGPDWVDTQSQSPTLCGFPGYKVGMTHVIKNEEKIRNKRYKQEVSSAVTILEIPKTYLFGVRAYKGTMKGLQAFSEVWTNEMQKDVARKLRVPSDNYTDERVQERISSIKDALNDVVELRALLYTLPKESGLPKKRPDILEVKIAGKDMAKNLDFAVENLGKEINILDHFSSDEYVDVTSVTKGKGFSGPVKRHGIKIMPRKKRKGRRVVGAIGSWHPARVSWTTPRAGNLGNHNRTEYNKKIVKIGENPRDINPSKGWKHYGVVKGNYLLIEGSVPGSTKRLVRLRKTIRKEPKDFPQADPVKIQYISLNFGQKEKAEENE